MCCMWSAGAWPVCWGRCREHKYQLFPLLVLKLVLVDQVKWNSKQISEFAPRGEHLGEEKRVSIRQVKFTRVFFSSLQLYFCHMYYSHLPLLSSIYLHGLHSTWSYAPIIFGNEQQNPATNYLGLPVMVFFPPDPERGVKGHMEQMGLPMRCRKQVGCFCWQKSPVARRSSIPSVCSCGFLHQWEGGISCQSSLPRYGNCIFCWINRLCAAHWFWLSQNHNMHHHCAFRPNGERHICMHLCAHSWETELLTTTNRCSSQILLQMPYWLCQTFWRCSLLFWPAEQKLEYITCGVWTQHDVSTRIYGYLLLKARIGHPYRGQTAANCFS